MCPKGCNFKDKESSKIWTSKIYANGKFKIRQKCALLKIFRYTVIFTYLKYEFYFV